MKMLRLITPLLAALSAAGAEAGVPEGEYDVIFVGLGLTSSVALTRLVRAHPHLRIAVVEKGGAVNAQLGATTPAAPGGLGNKTAVDVPGLYETMAFHPAADAVKDPAHPWTWQGMGYGGNAAYNGAWLQIPPAASFEGWPKGWGHAEMAGWTRDVLREASAVCNVTATPSADGRRYATGAHDALAAVFNSTAAAAGIFDMDAPHGSRAVYGVPHVAVTAAATRCFGYGVLRDVLGGDGEPTAQNLHVYNFSEVVEVVTSATPEGVVVPRGVLVRRAEAEFKLTVPHRTGRVVLSAGALGTAALLARSGFHSATANATRRPLSHNAALRAAVAHVGAAVSDHVGTGVAMRCPKHRGGGFFNPEAHNEGAKRLYRQAQSGPYAQFGPVFALYNRSTPSAPSGPDAANVEIFVNPWGMGDLADAADGDSDVFSAFAMHLNPAARSALPVDADGVTAYPMVYYPDSPEGVSDMKVVTEVLSAFLSRATSAGCEMVFGPGAPNTSFAGLDPRVQDDVAAYVKNWGPSDGVYFSHLIMNHFTGTVPLASAPGAHDGAVDPDTLAVLGTRGLHVCDASLAPRPIQAHPMGTLLGMGAKCADTLTRLLSHV